MANTSAEARDLVSALITSAWNTQVPGAPLFYTNQQTDRPDVPTLFGRMHMQFVDRAQITLGSVADGVRFRAAGTIFVQVFVPLGTGTDEYDAVCDALVVALENAGAAQNVWFRDVGMREIGSDGTYYQTNVEAAFQFDRVT